MAVKKARPVRNFSQVKPAIQVPDLLRVQRESFDNFLQADVKPEERLPQGLHKIFMDTFPIESSTKEFSLEYVSYDIGRPRHSIREAVERGVTFSAPLNATMRLVTRDPETLVMKMAVDQSTFLGELPQMTSNGSFIINGAERVIVSQLHRSPGVFFEEKTQQRGRRICTTRVIPQKGSWLDLTLDSNEIIFANIDKKPKRIPVTMLLRALGLSSDSELLQAFYPVKEKDINSVLKRQSKIAEIIHKSFAEDIVDPETGELIVRCDEPVENVEKLQRIAAAGIEKVKFLEPRNERNSVDSIRRTLAKEESALGAGIEKNESTATMWIYEALRGTEAPSLDHARSYLRSMFFDSKRYSLSEVGRYKLNERLNINVSMDKLTLTVPDLISIVDNLIRLREGTNVSDDIDHLGNRRVKTVGELLGQEFSKGLARMARTIKDRMGQQDREKLRPQDLVNSRTLSSVINSFFGQSQLSQFMEQTNPLAEITHKRRTSALGEGGLTRERAGFDVRDVHHTHYGRLCPVETPEGPNIGLITTLSVYASINRFGFLETPYRRVIKGKVTNEVSFLSADKEDRMTIAEADAPIDENNMLIGPLVRAKKASNYPMVTPDEVEYIDVSPMQLVGLSAALIPFLEHDDANRALMGSNMQRQAVPLLYTDDPVVGTGMEEVAARDSGALVLAERAGVVTHVDAGRIVVKADGDEYDFDREDLYDLRKFERSNQDTCVNQKPVVSVGTRVNRGDILADGMATSNGRLALGVNALVAFTPWNGYNYEDAIVVSERVVKDDTFTSVHIVEFETQFRETKLGPEELTRDLPNATEKREAMRNLDDNGIVRVGSRIRAGDLLVGKVSPKGEQDLSPEERLIRAIFGKRASDVKDTSLKAPVGMSGIVVDVKVYSRKDETPRGRREIESRIDALREERIEAEKRLFSQRDQMLRDVLLGQKAATFVDSVTGEQMIPEGRKITATFLKKVDFTDLDFNRQLVEDLVVDDRARRILRSAENKLKEINNNCQDEEDRLHRGDELKPGVIKLVKVYVAKRRKLRIGDKMAGRHGNKGVVSIIVPEEDMPYLPDGTPVDICLNPLGVPSRMNVGQIMETNLGMAAADLGINAVTPVFDSIDNEKIGDLLEEAGHDRDGKTVLFDGRTGEPFEHRVTVGRMYMLKLAHQVEDKIHARSTGPYAMVTQQPLGGKAQNGGQRLGEMEVWALEAYGAAHCLQEMLTIKSDDVDGRTEAYKAIVHGRNVETRGTPEAFNVLLSEMRSLALDVELDMSDERGNENA
ncbi:DNA-directed RNA polymerase subunit beta [Candidatus Fermentibacteria bacterium]|nr:MAG: DNA-directed RNA polymerase subunit beta [Candidatus Fermentibacteria bacterium]